MVDQPPKTSRTATGAEVLCLELNRLSRAIDTALLARAGGVALASLGILGLAIAPAIGQATTFTVTSTADSLDADTNDGVCETATAGECTLRAAVQQANASTGPDTVQFSLVSGSTITLTNGEIESFGPITIDGPGANNLTIDADSDGSGQGNSRHFFLYSNPGDTNTISGLTLINGYSSGDGGSIYSANCELSLDDVTAQYNEAGDDGGGLYCGIYTTSATPTLEISNSNFMGNQAGDNGGAVAAATFSSYLSLTVSSTEFSNNEAITDGGAVAAETLGGGKATITGNTFINNAAPFNGGGAYLDIGSWMSGPVDVRVEDNTFEANVANDGGGLRLDSTITDGIGSVVITGNTFTSNQATDDGGGVSLQTRLLISPPDTATFNTTLGDNQFLGNSAVSGGGGLSFSVLSDTGNSNLTLYGNQFDGNRSGRDGGGVYLNSSDNGGNTQTLLEQNSFSGNIAGVYYDAATRYQPGGNGGGLHARIDGNTTLTISNGNVFNANEAYPRSSPCYTVPDLHFVFGGMGGGLAVTPAYQSGGTAVISNTQITNNIAHGGQYSATCRGGAESATLGGRGGGAYLYTEQGNADFSIYTTTISGNSAEITGGGVVVGSPLHEETGSPIAISPSQLSIQDSAISGNTAAGFFGTGGLLVLTRDQTYFDLTNSTVSGNTGTFHGGVAFAPFGSFTSPSSYKHLIRHSTVVENTATDTTSAGLFAGGVYAGTNAISTDTLVTIQNSIVAGNSSPDLASGINTGSSFGLNHSLVQDLGNATYTDAGDSLIGLDPLLDPLASNGGPTATHALSANSPAFNAASAALSSGLPYDQRGAPNARIVLGAPDMGAYELAGPIPVTLSIDPNPANLAEATSDSAQITATLPAAIGEDVTVNLAATGSAGTADYDLTSNAIEIPAGSESAAVTLSAVNDALGEADEMVTLDIDSIVSNADGGVVEATPQQVTATLRDDDVPGITVNPTVGLTTTEPGGTDSFTVVLNTQPGAAVSIALSSDDTTEGTVSPASLTFNGGNWSMPQTVTVTGVDDPNDDGDIAFNIVTAPATSTDPAYDGANAADVTVTNSDDDAPIQLVNLSLSVSNVDEVGGASQITATLDRAATSDVTITLSLSGAAQAGTDFQVTGIPITIQAGQTQGSAQLTALDDSDVEGDEPFTVTVTAVTGAQLSTPPPEVTGAIVDDDQAQQGTAAPIPALGPLGLLLLPLLVPVVGWRYWRKRIL